MNYLGILSALRVISESASAEAVPAASCGAGDMWLWIVVYAAIIGLMYVIMIRPQKKRQKQEDELRRNIEVGDEIVTIGGICGRVVSKKDDDTIIIESGADRTKLKFKSWCVSTNESAVARAAAAKPEGTEKKGLFGGLLKK